MPCNVSSAIATCTLTAPKLATTHTVNWPTLQTYGSARIAVYQTILGSFRLRLLGHNTYDILNEDCSLSEYTDLDSTIRTDTSLLEPQNVSTPVAHNPAAGTGAKSARALKIITINFRSVVKNRDRLGVFLK